MDPELTRASHSQDVGFSLIEVLVVIAVMAVLATGVTITALRPSQDGANADHAWFERSFETNRALAIQGRKSRGLNVRPQGLVPVQLSPDGWAATPSAHRWRGRVAINARRGLGAPAQQPDIVFLSNGQTNAFDISFSTQQFETLRCRSDGWTGLKCEDI